MQVLSQCLDPFARRKKALIKPFPPCEECTSVSKDGFKELQISNYLCVRYILSAEFKRLVTLLKVLGESEIAASLTLTAFKRKKIGHFLAFLDLLLWTHIIDVHYLCIYLYRDSLDIV